MKYYYVVAKYDKEGTTVNGTFVMEYEDFSIVKAIKCAAEMLKADSSKVWIAFFSEVSKECYEEFGEYYNKR